MKVNESNHATSAIFTSSSNQKQNYTTPMVLIGDGNSDKLAHACRKIVLL